MTRNQPSDPTHVSSVQPMVWFFSAIGFFVGTCELLASGLVREISQSFQISTVSGGALVTAFAIGNIAGAVAAITIGRRTTGRRALSFAIGTFVVGAAFTAVMPAFAPAVVARLAAGAGAGAFWALAGAAVVATVRRNRRGRALSVFVAGNMLAAVVGAPVGSLIGQATSWRTVLIGIPVCALIAFAMCWSRIPRGDITGNPVTNQVRGGGMRVFLAWRIHLALLLVQAGVTACYTFLPVIAIADDTSIVLLQVSFGAGAVIGSQLGGPLSDSWPTRTAVIASSTSAAAIVFLWLSGVQGPVGVLAVGVMGAAGLACVPVLTARVAEATEPDYRAAMALNPAVLNVGIALGSFTAAQAVEISGRPDSSFSAGAVLATGAIGAVVLAVTWAQRDRRQRRIARR